MAATQKVCTVDCIPWPMAALVGLCAPGGAQDNGATAPDTANVSDFVRLCALHMGTSRRIWLDRLELERMAGGVLP
ncbi:MAG TPA: hypothetical protein DGT21_24340 [Armatimonadetes bacterium]|nr:hypothetical protein [Armatimonadota bacterium]